MNFMIFLQKKSVFKNQVFPFFPKREKYFLQRRHFMFYLLYCFDINKKEKPATSGRLSGNTPKRESIQLSALLLFWRGGSIGVRTTNSRFCAGGHLYLFLSEKSRRPAKNYFHQNP